MSNQFHHKHSYSRHFMAPVWIALALGGMGVAFLLGGAVVTDEWSRQDNEKLAEYKPGAPVVVPVAERVQSGWVSRQPFATDETRLRNRKACPPWCGGAPRQLWSGRRKA